MLKAIIAGQTDARKLAALCSERLAASRETPAAALQGKVTRHHRFLLKQHLQMIEHLEKPVTQFDAYTRDSFRSEGIEGFRCRRGDCHPLASFKC
jgi:hypothetical protein